MHLLVIFLAGYATVFLLGFQSRCVNHGNYQQAACCSFVIGMMQTTLWGALFKDLSWAGMLTYGLSGACGITSSMWMHRRWLSRGPTPDRIPKGQDREAGLEAKP